MQIENKERKPSTYNSAQQEEQLHKLAESN